MVPIRHLNNNPNKLTMKNIKRKSKNLYRIDINANNLHGWQFRTHVGGVDRSKWFADSKFGDNMYICYLAASSYRDGAMAVLKS